MGPVKLKHGTMPDAHKETADAFRPNSKVSAFFKWVVLICEKICMTIIITLLVLVSAGIFLRMVNIGIPWVEEVCLYLMVWLGMIGAVILVVEEGHVCITFLFEKFPLRVQLTLKLVFEALMVYALVIYIKYGWVYMVNGKKTASTSLPITRMIPNAAIPVGAVLMSLCLILLMVRDVRRFIWSYTNRTWEREE